MTSHQDAADAGYLGYLDRIYADGDDPWHLEAGEYEDRKRDLLLACLPLRHFVAAFEPGCAAGRLSEALASRCRSLLAADAHPRAVAQVRTRTAALRNVTVQQLVVPRDWPQCQRFDLIVLSEFGYYLPPVQWRELAERARASITPDGTVIACHWRHPFAERQIGTASLHNTIGRVLPLPRRTQVRDEDFLLDMWSAAAVYPPSEPCGKR